MRDSIYIFKKLLFDDSWFNSSGSVVRWFGGSAVRWFDGSVVRWFDGSMVRWFGGSVVRIRMDISELKFCSGY
jgi:hypothetical protein